MVESILLVFLALIILVGPAMSEDKLLEITDGNHFDYKDSVKGVGSFSSYSELISLREEQIKKIDHGSGAIDEEAFIGSNQTANFDLDSYFIRSAFAVLARNNMVYEPRTIAVGTGYYAANPLRFNSRLGSTLQIKNYASEALMVHETKYAAAINGLMKAATITTHSSEGHYFDAGEISMSRSGEVSEGITHIGMVHSETHDWNYDKTARSIANVDVDEVFSGSFDIKTNMSLYWPVTRTFEEDSWLPCCSGGWKNMSYSDQEGFGKDINGLLDCTCHDGTGKQDR